MIKLIIPKHGSNAISLDTETLEITETQSYNTNIDYAYYIDQDCEIVFDGKTYEVVSGDIVYKMYGVNNERTLIVIKSKELVEYNKEYEIAVKLDQEKWKLKDLSSECRECIGTCEG